MATGLKETAQAQARPRLDAADVERLVRTRRHPSLTQFDGLHLRILRDNLSATLAALPIPVADALDVFCGARPYDDLIPAIRKVVGYDIDDHYGVADVVGGDFLPFDDESFDLVTCIEGFQYVADPSHGAAEIGRVLRPGGFAVLSVPLVWEYDRLVPEHRYTGPSLAALFAGWDEVRVLEDGGRGVAWSTLTGQLLTAAFGSLPRPLRFLLRPLEAGCMVAINLAGAAIERREQGNGHSTATLPMNLTLVARKPA